MVSYDCSPALMWPLVGDSCFSLGKSRCRSIQAYSMRGCFDIRKFLTCGFRNSLGVVVFPKSLCGLCGAAHCAAHNHSIRATLTAMLGRALRAPSHSLDFDFYASILRSSFPGLVVRDRFAFTEPLSGNSTAVDRS